MTKEYFGGRYSPSGQMPHSTDYGGRCADTLPIPGVIAKPKPADESALRKSQPLARGCLLYFPDALKAVAQLSMYGNDKHNPGQPLHWSREKSNDHADCVLRHIAEGPLAVLEEYGPGKSVLHSVAAAWRALANAQVEIEKLRAEGKWPLAV